MYTDEDYQNKMILFDRYYHSAIAYRMAEGINKEWVMTLNSVFKKPDIGFYIDITPEESVKRNINTKFNIIAPVEHLSKVRNAYLSFLEEENLIYIDGMQEMGVNLMIEQSCNILVKDMEQLLNNITELKNEEKI